MAPELKGRLIGETIGVQRASVRHEVVDGVATLSVGDFLESETAPYRWMDGTITTLRDSLFSTVPGSPAWVGKTKMHNLRLPQYGMEWSLPDRNAIQAVYHMTHRND